MKAIYETDNLIIKTRMACIVELTRELAIRRNTKVDK